MIVDGFTIIKMLDTKENNRFTPEEKTPSMLLPKDIERFCNSMLELFTITEGNGESYLTIEELHLDCENPENHHQLAFWSTFLSSLGQELKEKGFKVEGLISSSIIPSLVETLDSIRAAKSYCKLNLYNQLDTYNKALQLFKIFCQKHGIEYQVKELHPHHNYGFDEITKPTHRHSEKLIRETLEEIEQENIKTLILRTFGNIDLTGVDDIKKLRTFLTRLLIELKFAFLSYNPDFAEKLNSPEIKSLQKSPEDYLGSVEARKYFKLFQQQMQHGNFEDSFIENFNALSKWASIKEPD